MTGALDSPTIDILLAKRLGLNLDVKRTSVEGMGCLTGYRMLNLAVETSHKQPEKRILVIEADLRSLIGYVPNYHPVVQNIPIIVDQSHNLLTLWFRPSTSVSFQYHYVYYRNSLPSKLTRSDIVSAALFRDAASACVVGSTPRQGETIAYEGETTVYGAFINEAAYYDQSIGLSFMEKVDIVLGE